MSTRLWRVSRIPLNALYLELELPGSHPPSGFDILVQRAIHGHNLTSDTGDLLLQQPEGAAAAPGSTPPP